MGTLRIVEALIEGGADPTQQTTDGWLAVDAAHTVGALTDEMRRLLTKAVALKAPAGIARSSMMTRCYDYNTDSGTCPPGTQTRWMSRGSLLNCLPGAAVCKAA